MCKALIPVPRNIIGIFWCSPTDTPCPPVLAQDALEVTYASLTLASYVCTTQALARKGAGNRRKMSLFLPVFSLSAVGCYVMVRLGLSLRLLDMCRCLLTLQCFRMAVCSHLRWCYSQRTMELREEPITSRGWGLRKRKLCSFILRQNFKEVTLSDSDSTLYQRLSMLLDWRTDNIAMDFPWPDTLSIFTILSLLLMLVIYSYQPLWKTSEFLLINSELLMLRHSLEVYFLWSTKVFQEEITSSR